MTPKILKYLKQYSTIPIDIDRLIVSSFIRFNDITVEYNRLINSYLLSDNNEPLITFLDILKSEIDFFTIEDLIILFEFVISPAEKEINGAVYTPRYIRDYIVNQTLNHFGNIPLNNLVFADISCGCGGFFYTLAIKIKKSINTTFQEIYQNNIIGVDIKQYSVDRTKLLLSLLAIQNGEDIEVFNFNLFCANSLNFNFQEIPLVQANNGISAIIGNPPYVGSSKIDNDSKLLLDKWSVTRTGKMDLYIPFFQIAIENLSTNGILGYITVNNFYRSVNGRGIRKYFSSNKYPLRFIDFGAEQVFKGRSTYTCLCFIVKTNDGHIEYIKTKSENINKIRNKDYLKLNYKNLDDHKGWILQKSSIAKNIDIIERTGTPLGKLFDIKNGFATLKNDVYLFNPIETSDTLYSFEKDGEIFWIEKAICRNAIKPNTLKYENDINAQKEKLIFPYKPKEMKDNLFPYSSSLLDIIDEIELKEKYPLAHRYLETKKTILAKRDKGQREYPTWYAFGRSQALTIQGNKLLFPYIADKPYFVLTNDQDLLFYNGYALVSNYWDDLLIIQKVLKSDLFWYYIKQTSKPYGSEYYALAKNYIKNFGVYNFSIEQKEFLLNTDDLDLINSFLIELYGIKL